MSEVRLQVVLARAGLASRRGAEALIEAGRVTVNGQVTTKLGTKVDPARDVVTLDGEVVGARQPRATVLLYKPVQVVTTMSDPRGRETVAELVKDEPGRLLPVGRLDYHTEGLLLMSTDGDLIERLLHPRHHVPKVYVVKVAGQIRDAAVTRLTEGVALEDGRTHPAVVEVLEAGPRASWLEIVVTEGRNRLVRRMTEAVGHEAFRVIRTEVGTVTLGDLKPGQYRYAVGATQAALYRSAGLPIPRRLAPRARETDGAILGKARRGKGTWPGR